MAGWVVALAVTLAAAPVAGQASPEASMADTTVGEHDMDDVRARAAFRLGRQYYDEARFAEAGVEFERAFGLSGRTQLLYNAYLAYRDARDDENAIRTLRGYLSGVSDVPDRAHLEARLAVLESSVAEQRAREARAQADTEEARRQAAEPPVESYREVPGEVWPWVVLGVGGAMVVAGAITGGIALGQRDDLSQQCPNGLCPAGFGLEARQQDIQTLAITTDVLLIGGGVTAAVGLVLGLVLGPRRERVEAPVSAGCTSSGCFGTVRGEF